LSIRNVVVVVVVVKNFSAGEVNHISSIREITSSTEDSKDPFKNQTETVACNTDKEQYFDNSLMIKQSSSSNVPVRPFLETS
jgi:hypothetical protein